MIHKKIIKREDGIQVKVEISFDFNFLDKPRWVVYLCHKLPCDKMWDGRSPQETLKYISPEKIKQAKMELWEKLKPE